MPKKKDIPASPFVPEGEQPYPVPENWCWVTIGAIALVKGGKRIPKGSKLVEYKTEHPYIRVTDFDNCSIDTEQVKYIDEETFELIQNYTISTQDIYISIAGTIGKVGVIPDDLDGANLTENAAKITNIRGVEKNFLLWLLQSEVAQSQMRDSTISTTQPKLALFRIENIKFPLSPLEEQRRIVSRIESLFAKLDAAKEKAQAVVDGFELRKSAILHKAFTGELTERWRKEHGVGLDSWEKRNIQSVCAMKITDGTHKTPIYCEEDEGIPFISAKDVTSGKICWDNIRYIIPELHEELYQRLAPQVDDILLAKNGTTGVAAIVEEEKIFDLYVTLAVLRPNKETIVPEYLLHIVNSPICKLQFDEHLTGIGVPNLHLRDIKEVLLNVPSLEEQREIVRIIDKIIVNHQQAQEAAEAVLTQTDTMKKAILARAFRGELGTNDPAEEWAGALLEAGKKICF